MADFVKLFHVDHAYVDEDGYLSFNPKHKQSVGIVFNNHLDMNPQKIDVSSYDNPNSYVTGLAEYLVTMTIQLDHNILNDSDTPKEIDEPDTVEIKKYKVKTQKEFAFLDIKD